MLADCISPSGNLTYTPTPPFFTASVADPSVHAWIHASSGHRSAVLASQCQKAPDGVVLGVSRGDERDCGVDLETPVFSFPQLRQICRTQWECGLWQVSSVFPSKSLTFMDETAALVMVLCQSIHPFFHGKVWQAFEFLCLDHDLGTSHLTLGLDRSSCLHSLDWCRSDGASDDPENLVLDLVQYLLFGHCCV